MAAKTKKRWQRQETRPVRPFRSASDYLADAGLRLYADDEFTVSETIHVKSVDRARLALEVSAPAIPANFEDVVGLEIDGLRLVIAIEDRAFKNSVVVENVPLSNLTKAKWFSEIDVADLEPFSWVGETRVYVAVVLANERTGEIGTAQRVGSWVARKSFSIGTPRDTASFHIDAVDPEYFVKLGLPAETTYFVEINDTDLNQPCESLPDLVKISLAKDVHTALAKDEESQISKALINSIYVDVVTTVLATGFASLENDKILENGILDVVTKKLVKSTGVPVEKLRKFASHTAGSQLRAVVQADIEFSRALIAAAQRR